MQRFIAIPLILVFLPLALIISGVQLLVFHRIFFVQQRTGKNLSRFRLIKFQSMSGGSYRQPAIPPWGKFLRQSSIDELPQLWNVVTGDMNFVGPRPLLPEYEPLYSARQRKRHAVKPGITGWAQVQGRNTLSWEEQFELDVWYVENRSVSLDLKIIRLTFYKIFRSGSSETRQRPPFKGSSQV